MKDIFVIGAVHLDVIADYGSAVNADIDKPGKAISYSIGGCGYNIACNLSQHGYPVTFYTLTKKNSLSAFIIQTFLRRSHIKTHFQNEDYPETGYIAQLCDSRLNSAVSYSNYEVGILEKEVIEQIVKQSKLVIIDTNLTTFQIDQVSNICLKLNRPLFVACVSQSKVDRIRNEIPSFRYKLVAMNENEAYRLFGDNFGSLANEKICDIAFAEQVVVTYASRGFEVYDRTKKSSFTAPSSEKVVSEVGAGDALIAAVCAYYFENNQIDWNLCNEINVRRFVLPVLKVNEATVGASNISSLPRGTNLESKLCINFLTLSILLTAMCIGWEKIPVILFFICLLIIPLLAGASGSLASSLWEQFHDIFDHTNIYKKLALGMFAGFFAAFLFLLAQIASNPIIRKDLAAAITDGLNWLAAFELAIGLVGGFTLDKVFNKIKKINLHEFDTISANSPT